MRKLALPLLSTFLTHLPFLLVILFYYILAKFVTFTPALYLEFPQLLNLSFLFKWINCSPSVSIYILGFKQQRPTFVNLSRKGIDQKDVG